MCKTEGCKWTVEPVDIKTTFTEEPVFDNNFNHHMMDGDVKDGSLSGLHSRFKLKKDEVPYEIVANQNGGTNGVPDNNCPHIFSAKIKIGKKEKFGKIKYSDEKLSSFFPDDMCEVCVKQATKFAWQNYESNKNGNYHTSAKQNLGLSDSGPEKAKWAGRVKITKGNAAYTIWLGSLATGKGGSKIKQSFPALSGSFL